MRRQCSSEKLVVGERLLDPVLNELGRLGEAMVAQLAGYLPSLLACRLHILCRVDRLQHRRDLAHRWDGLSRFLDDGRLEIDTNVVERSIRPIALNRKNALFAGSDEGGANWAIIASLIETAKLNSVSVNPHAWLTDTLTTLVDGWPASRTDELMPWNYAKAEAA